MSIWREGLVFGMYGNFKAGVTSSTLRQYAYRNFIRHVVKTELSCIEWGSDIHVPYSDTGKAAEVAVEMALHKLAVSSYGTYYRLGWLHEASLFDMILDIARTLGAPMLRVWGGGIAGKYVGAEMRREMVGDALEISAAAKKSGISISLEYHQESITDTAENALSFINEVRSGGGENIYLYWQPRPLLGFSENKRELAQVLPFLSNIHVQACEGSARLLLREHSARWREYIKIIKDGGGKHNFLLELTKDDRPDFFIEDAKELAGWLGEA